MNDEIIKLLNESLIVQKEMLDYMKSTQKLMREVKVRIEDKLKDF